MHNRDSHTIAAMLCVLVLPLTVWAGSGDSGVRLLHEDHSVGQPVQQGSGHAHCAVGVANGYACTNIDLMSQMDLADIGGGQNGSDSWGWKDTATDSYYAIITRSNGTAFINVTDPENPVYLGNLATAGGSAGWRDVKTYQNHAFIVADGAANNSHGMQVFDLTRLRGQTAAQEFTADVRDTSFGNAHNIAINEATGFAYIVGSDQCAGGLHMIDIRTPKQPVFAGCFSGDGYTHDVQCVNYQGPDAGFQGREVCFASNEDTLTIVDVSDKQAPFQLAKIGYPNVGYTHQGWLTDDHRYFIQGDEVDELAFGLNTRTVIFDVTSLRAPSHAGDHIAATSVIDHNLYVKDGYVYQANYEGGIRILKILDAASARLQEVAFFDTAPDQDTRNFAGSWNVYPFFDNNIILASDINRGMFVLRANLGGAVSTGMLDGTMSGQWVAADMPDQGLMLLVDQNASGRYVFFTWYTYKDGEPFWLVGNTFYEPTATSVVIPALRLEGLSAFDTSGSRASRTDVGTVEVEVVSCNEIRVRYDLDQLGSGDIPMTRLVGVESHACLAGDAG